ncbi:TITAN-like protein isoform X2 [Coffea arabica]|uniref:TITAN-like protein isoform X2 n=1 Tax=Coffea arabica TaxID=13443 RepID=A0ABM4U8C7_COFAR
MPIQNPNPNKKKKKHSNQDDDEDDTVQGKQRTQFEFCKACRLNHNQGRRHIYFPNHKKALSSFLSRFQSKLKNDVAFYLKKPMPLRPEHAALNRLWCVFCDFDILESDSSFACSGNAIAHLASAEHLKGVKSFLWKYGGGMDRMDSFRISESDFTKWEKKCKLLKSEAAGGGSHGSLIGPLNDIHNESKSEYVNSFDKNKLDCLTSDVKCSNSVVPLQDHTIERSQISHSKICTVGPQILHAGTGVGLGARTPNGLPGFFGNQHYTHSVPKEGPAYSCPNDGKVYSYEGIAIGDRHSQGTSSEESRLQSLQNLTQISSSAQENGGGNVHSGAPPPWFSAAEKIQLDNKLNQGLGDLVSSLGEQMKTSKLNPKRVGAAWAERRKIELELEKRGELVRHDFGADWLPNFGRVWQSGSRKDSRKEFLGENKTWRKVDSQIEKPSQFQPYISKRMRTDNTAE